MIVIADTAREQPAMTVNILDKQPRLTVSNLASKIAALQAGLGIGSMPRALAHKLHEQGRLKIIDGSESEPVDLVLAWRRNQLGKAKSWAIKYLTQHWPSDAS